MMIQAFSNLDGTVEKLKDATTDAFRKVEFEKGDSGKFTVNGEEVDCTGYKAVIDKDTVESIVGVYSDSLKEEESVMKLIERFGGSEFDLDDIKSQITSKMNEDDVLNLNVYLYDGQAAAIVADARG
jgi:tRNA(Ser,Leu) C12 N-acetylase TAN1